MAWIVDKNHIDTHTGATPENGGKVKKTRVLSRQFEGLNYDKARALEAGCILKFRLKDADGLVYFSGRCTPDADFAPKDEYGVAFGAVIVEQFVNHRWEVL